MSNQIHALTGGGLILKPLGDARLGFYKWLQLVCAKYIFQLVVSVCLIIQYSSQFNTRRPPSVLQAYVIFCVIHT